MVMNSVFFDRAVNLLEVQLCQEILWEVYEIGFQLELLAIDKLLCSLCGNSAYRQVTQEQERMGCIMKIFEQDSNIHIMALPTSNHSLATNDICNHVPTLEALYQVLIHWPMANQTISISPITNNFPIEVLEMREKHLVQFYVDTFFIHSSYVLIVPHIFL